MTLKVSSTCWIVFCLQLFAHCLQGNTKVQRFRNSFSTKLSANDQNAFTLSNKFALLFDCDGVIVETEELHRIAYNKAFAHYGLTLSDGSPVHWDLEYYDKLQNTVGGGKPKMKYHFTQDKKQWPRMTKPYRAPPSTPAAQSQLIDMLQDKKTEYYTSNLRAAEPRKGVLELMDAAIAHPQLVVGICSAATKEGFVKLTEAVVGTERLGKLDIVLAGDDVPEKKPSPRIYLEAAGRLSIPPERCVVIEDSMVGLRAAKAANMRCIITYTSSTEREDFYKEGADVKIGSLQGVTLKDIFLPLDKDVKGEVLQTLREGKK